MEYRDFVTKNGEKIFDFFSDARGFYELPLLEFALLKQEAGIRHGFTTRRGGVSRGEFASLNLSFTRGDDSAAVEENYRRIATAFGVSCGDIVCTDQTHTTNVMRVDRSMGGAGVTRPKPYRDVDGLITDEPGLLLAAFSADCVPLFFVDPVHRAIGLAHSGWRGTVERMGAVTLAAMEREFGTKPADVLAAAGPSICGDCYEIGAEAAEEFQQVFGAVSGDILRKKGRDEKGEEKYLLDLWRCNEHILLDAGVAREHLAVTNICTCCNPELLFSHRASHGKRGSLGAFLMLMP